MSDKTEKLYLNKLLLGVTGFFSIAVFIIDIYTPVGVSGGVVYMLFVLTSYWNEKKITIIAGALASFLILAGFVLSTSSMYLILSFVNHILAIVVIWISVWFINSYRASILAVKKNYQVLFQVTNDEILVFLLDEKDQALPFLEVNDSASEILGYSRDELLDMTLYDISLDEKDVGKRIKAALKHGETLFESFHQKKQGEVIPLEFKMRAFIYDGQKAIISAGRDLRERRKLEQEILEVSEIERQRIGRDLHDDVGQLLTAAVISAQMFEKHMNSKDIEDSKKVKEIVELIKTAAEHSRNVSHGLVPVNVVQKGLSKAIQEMIQNISAAQSIEIQFTGVNIIPKNNTTAIQVYRIAQEAISNAVKHAKASKIDVDLHEDKNFITLQIKDNGTGIPENYSGKDGIGLRTMYFRANMIGGTLIINSEINSGTEVICQFPKANF